MNCPRCKTTITQSFDPESIILCPGCGSRLMTRAAALRSQGGKTSLPDDSSPPEGIPPPADPEATPPAGTPGSLEPAPSGGNPPVAAGGSGPAPVPPEASSAPSLALVLHELQMIRVTQVQILEALKRVAGGGAEAVRSLEDPGPDATQVLAPVRSRRRKAVLLIDDDAETQKAAVEELKQADVPVRAVGEGNAALAAIAENKPDVVALELGLGGEMAGKDLINMIKATMEWVDIPIVLWTREPVHSQKEARLQHGADEVVHKDSGAAALVTRVITLFRRA